MSALLLSALLGCENLKKRTPGGKKEPSVNDRTRTMETAMETRKRGRPLYSHVQTFDLFELLI